jgi:hypothetical protein
VSLPSSANQPVPKPGTNVYTVMLILSFLAICVACGLLYSELRQFGPGTPWAVPSGS